MTGGACATLYAGERAGRVRVIRDGRVRALAAARGRPLRHRDLGLRLPGLVSFAESPAGELYVLSLAGGVHRLAAAA